MPGTHPADEPVFGFNTEISYRSQVFHVQTENMSAGDNRSINTLVYLKGTLVSKISTASATMSAAPPVDDLQEQVKRQHQAVLNRVRQGEFSR